MMTVEFTDKLNGGTYRADWDALKAIMLVFENEHHRKPNRDELFAQAIETGSAVPVRQAS